MFEEDGFPFNDDLLRDIDIEVQNKTIGTNKRPNAYTEPIISKKLRTEGTAAIRNISNKGNSNVSAINQDKQVLGTDDGSSEVRIPPENKIIVKRKFPGPAGLLPDYVDFNIDVNEFDNQNRPLPQIPTDFLCSQTTTNGFQLGTWLQMCEDFRPNRGFINLLEKYNIAWIKSRAEKKRLYNQKAPFLAAVIKSIETCKGTTTIAAVELKDPTGEIQGTFSTGLYEEYAPELKVDSVMVLKQIGVFTCESKHYLTITSNNLITIYSSHQTAPPENHQSFQKDIFSPGTSSTQINQSQRPKEGEKIKITSVNTFEQEKFLENIEEIKRVHKKESEKNRPSFDDGLNSFNFSFKQIGGTSVDMNVRSNNSAMEKTNNQVKLASVSFNKENNRQHIPRIIQNFNVNNNTSIPVHRVNQYSSEGATSKTSVRKAEMFNFKTIASRNASVAREDSFLKSNVSNLNQHENISNSINVPQNITNSNRFNLHNNKFETIQNLDDHLAGIDLHFSANMPADKNQKNMSEAHTDFSSKNDSDDDSFLLSVSQQIEEQFQDNASEITMVSCDYLPMKHLHDKTNNTCTAKNENYLTNFGTNKPTPIYEKENNSRENVMQISKNNRVDKLQIFKFKPRIKSDDQKVVEISGVNTNRTATVMGEGVKNTSVSENDLGLYENLKSASQVTTNNDDLSEQASHGTLKNYNATDMNVLKDIFSGVDADSLFDDF